MYGIFVALGLAIGWAIGRGPLQGWGTMVDQFNAALITYGQGLVDWLVAEGSTIDGTQTSLAVFAPVVGVALPGLVALTLAGIVRASTKLRKIASGIAVLFGLGAFFVVDPAKAAIIAVVVLIGASAASLVTGVAIQFPLVVLASVLGIRQVTLLVEHRDPAVQAAVDALMLVAATPDPDIYRVLLTFTGIVPFVAALWLLIKD